MSAEEAAYAAQICTRGNGDGAHVTQRHEDRRTSDTNDVPLYEALHVADNEAAAETSPFSGLAAAIIASPDWGVYDLFQRHPEALLLVGFIADSYKSKILLLPNAVAALACSLPADGQTGDETVYDDDDVLKQLSGCIRIDVHIESSPRLSREEEEEGLKGEKKEVEAVRNGILKALIDAAVQLISPPPIGCSPFPYNPTSLKKRCRYARMHDNMRITCSLTSSQHTTTARTCSSLGLCIDVLVVTGCYRKFSRAMSQTKWTAKESQKNETISSVEEAIALPLKDALGSSMGFKFMAAGREDVDVRMLGRGRPFVLELYRCEESPLSLATEEAMQPKSCGVSVACRRKTRGKDLEEAASLEELFTAMTNHKVLFDGSTVDVVKQPLQTSRLAVEVLDCEFSAEKPNDLKRKLHLQSEQKLKTYEALVWVNVDISQETVAALNSEWRQMAAKELLRASAPETTRSETTAVEDNENDENQGPGEEEMPRVVSSEESRRNAMSPADRITHMNVTGKQDEQQIKRCLAVDNLQDYRPIEVFQDTPLRVLHRRTAATRRRLVYQLELRLLHPHYLVARVTTQAGTYIKEFVHGDLGRTHPCLRSLLAQAQCMTAKCPEEGPLLEVDILLLDVVGLLWEADLPKRAPFGGNKKGGENGKRHESAAELLGQPKLSARTPETADDHHHL